MSSQTNKVKPLTNRTVLVACSEKKMSELSEGVEALGGRTFPLPLIELREMEDKQWLDRAITSVNRYHWLIFTSAYGVSFFMRRLKELGMDPVTPLPKICAIGPATAKAVKQFGFEVSLVPEKFTAEGIVEALEGLAGGLLSLAGQRILLPRALEARDILPDALRAAGASVDVVPCYRNVQGEISGNTIRELRAIKPDLIVFTSSSTVRNLIDILGGEDGKKMLQESIVAVLGPITRSTVQSFGKDPEILPKESTIASLVEEIRSYYSRNFSIDNRP